MKLYRLFPLLTLLTLFHPLAITAQDIVDDSYPPRVIPSRSIPIPTTISPEMQKLDAKRIRSVARFIPTTKFEWNVLIIAQRKLLQDKLVAKAQELFPVDVKEEIMGGVHTYVITPKSMPEENANRVLINTHGGGYVLLGGEGSLPEAMAMAYYGQFKVIAIDYRMPPKYPFPAALEDTIAVYQEVLKTYKPENIGIFGTSAGGGLAAAVLLKLRDMNLPFPKVAGFGTPWSDLSGVGDTYHTNEDIDNVLVTYDGIVGAAARLYAGSYDLKDPYISPVYGEYTKDFPPAILISGTRDLFLSNTVRLFRKLRQAGVDAELQVFEGVPHAFYLMVLDSPESREVFQELVTFFNKHFR